MIGVSVKPSASSAERSAPTRPSIMSLGATASAPARAWETAVRASSSSDASLSTRALSRQATAVAVVGVLAEADVGEDEQLGVRGLDRARGELDRAVVVPGAGAVGVLLGGDAEEQDGRDAERVGGARLLDDRRRCRGGRRPASRRSACGPPGRPRRTAAARGPTAPAWSRARGRAARRCGAAGAGGWRERRQACPTSVAGAGRCRTIAQGWACSARAGRVQQAHPRRNRLSARAPPSPPSSSRRCRGPPSSPRC